MVLGGAVLRIASVGVRAIQLLIAILILGIFSYFLAILSDHDLHIDTWVKAVEGMSGAAVLYTAFGVILTLCLGGISFFAMLAILLDICFIGCFVAIAILTRGGTDDCSGNYVHTPLGDGNPHDDSLGFGSDGFGTGDGENVTYFPDLGLACRLEKAAFAVSIVNVVLFIISAGLQVLMARHHKHEKRYGPSPANNYTSGIGRRPFWQRKNRHVARDAEASGGLAADKHHDMRPSHETGYTGTTVGAAPNTYGGSGYGQARGVTASNF